MDKIFNGDRIPREKTYDYSWSGIRERANFIRRKTNVKLCQMLKFSIPPYNMMGNIENVIGCAQIPIGLAGPLKIKGEYANGIFYVPMATTEGALVHSTSAGMKLLTQSGGVQTRILKDFLHVSPIFLTDSSRQTEGLKEYVNKNFQQIKSVAESTTRHGKLLSIELTIIEEGVILTFFYYTADAAGQNMICSATERACRLILENTDCKKFYIRSGFSSDKKISSYNCTRGYGKEVVAEAVIPKDIFVEKNLKTTPEELNKLLNIAKKAFSIVNMEGQNAQVANIVTAIFIACGQDPAGVVNAASAVTSGYLLCSGDICMKTVIHNLVVGTAGGGTHLDTQKECLEILGCYGSGKTKKFAEIVAASVLSGEIAITISIANGTFVEGHNRLGRKRIVLSKPSLLQKIIHRWA